MKLVQIYITTIITIFLAFLLFFSSSIFPSWIRIQEEKLMRIWILDPGQQEQNCDIFLTWTGPCVLALELRAEPGLRAV